MTPRLIIILVLAILVVAVALSTRRWQRPTHRRISVSDTGLPAGLVIFTSTDCANCKDALAVVKASGLPVREVTWELEGALLERIGIESVPLVVLVDGSGAVVDQVVGVPPRRWIQRVRNRT